mmetsp:Transcript_51892/g.112834  ORF Transcript_51892/g.112834 Transcript_51892/m.112834 type:complete len:727 (-) Transcript_51892:8-2188(-)
MMAGHVQYQGQPMGWPGQPQLYSVPQHYQPQPQPQPLPGFWPTQMQPPLTPQTMYTATAVPPSPWHPGPQMAYMQQPPQNPWQMPTQPMPFQTSYGWNPQPYAEFPGYGASPGPMYGSQEPSLEPAGQPSLTATPEQVAELARDLGVDPGTEEDLCWIAEYGLQPSALPPGWTSQVDDESGKIYYINEDSQESVWDNPLKPHLQQVVDTGRAYLARPRPGFWEEARLHLLEVRQQEMDEWTGPFLDDSGRHYYANPVTGESQWKDPRESAQFCLELVANLFVSLSQVLPGPDEFEAPMFGSTAASDHPAQALPVVVGEKVLTENGAEVLTLEGSPGNRSTGSPSDYSPSSSPARARSSWMRSLAMESSANERASTLQSMGRALLWLSEASQAEELAQRRQLKRRVELRRLRKMRSSQHMMATASKTRSEEARLLRQSSQILDSANGDVAILEEQQDISSNALADSSSSNNINNNSNIQHKSSSPQNSDIMQTIDCSSSSKHSSPNDGASATGSTLYGASSCAGSNCTSVTAEMNPLRTCSLDGPLAPSCGGLPEQSSNLADGDIVVGKSEQNFQSSPSSSPLPLICSALPAPTLKAPEAPLQVQSAGPSPQHNNNNNSSCSCSTSSSPMGPEAQGVAGGRAAPLAAADLLLSEEPNSPPNMRNISSPAPVTFAFAPAPAPAAPALGTSPSDTVTVAPAASKVVGDPEAVVSIAPGCVRAVTFEDVT